ncbi:MAG: prolyl-tRNA synthetase associated domain-containing protein [Alphaproteobacteria bacterium]|nr:MAG: hypothetical protein B6I23_02920 [Rickettsiaceae bacterium 4572_127]
MVRKNKLLNFLKENKIDFEEVLHPPVFTCEDADKLKENIQCTSCKNLFLTDKKRYFIFATLAHEKVNLKKLKEKIGVSRLSFGKPEKLFELLKLTPGSVNPFAVFFDETNFVELILDSKMMEKEKLGFHPMKNDSTIILTPQELEKFLKKINTNYRIISI